MTARGSLARLVLVGLASLAACAPLAPAGPPATAPAAPPAGRQTLDVFAAASLVDVFGELGRRFEAAQPGAQVAFNFAGSQQLRVQLEQGASADVFASANRREMDAAIGASLVVSGTPRVFAHGHLVAIIPAANPGHVSTLADLARPGLKLVVTDRAVPAGQYTLEMLHAASRDPAFGADFADRVLANVVSREDNVKSVVAKVRLGEADAGIVYTTDAAGAAAADLKTLPIPDRLNPIADYPIAVLARARQPELARQFVAFVLSAEGQRVLAGFGFIPAAGS